MAIVLYGDIKIDFGVVYEHSLEEILLREMGERRLTLVADNEVVLMAHFGTTGEAFGTWTNNRGMVNLAIDYISHDVISLKLARQFAPQMNALFGKKWERLRDVMNSNPPPPPFSSKWYEKGRKEGNAMGGDRCSDDWRRRGQGCHSYLK